jgi:hypothetical protein
LAARLLRWPGLSGKRACGRPLPGGGPFSGCVLAVAGRACEPQAPAAVLVPRAKRPLPLPLAIAPCHCPLLLPLPPLTLRPRFKGALQEVNATFERLHQEARIANITAGDAQLACRPGCVALGTLLPAILNATGPVPPPSAIAAGAAGEGGSGRGNASTSSVSGGSSGAIASGAHGSGKKHLYSVNLDAGSWIGGGGAPGGRIRIGDDAGGMRGSSSSGSSSSSSSSSSGGSSSSGSSSSSSSSSSGGGGDSSWAQGSVPSCVCLSSTRGSLQAGARRLREALLPATAGIALVALAGLWLLAGASGALALARRVAREARRQAAGAPLPVPPPALDFPFSPRGGSKVSPRGRQRQRLPSLFHVCNGGPLLLWVFKLRSSRMRRWHPPQA